MSDERVPRSTHLHETKGSPDADSVQRVREALEAAKDADPDGRDEYVKAALGETIGLKTAGVMNAPDVEENLTSILTRPDEEAPFFANQALQELERVQEEVEAEAETEVDSDAGTDDEAGRDAPLDADTDEDEPPECVRWTGQDAGVIEIELTRAMVEWLALEADEWGRDDVEEFARWILQNWLERDLATAHNIDAPVAVDVPEDVARRAALMYADHAARGWDPNPLDIAHTYVGYNLAFRLDGEPWELTEGEDRSGGEADG